MGLSQNTVYCFCQDEKGFIWIGTQEGLNRFDGSHILVYRHSSEQNSIQDNYVSALRSSNSKIFIGALNGRLSYFESGVDKFTEVSHFENAGRARTDTITQISEAEPGKLYFSTLNSGFCTLAPTHENNPITILTKNPHPGNVSCFTEIGDGNFILGTFGNGLWILNATSGSCHKLSGNENATGRLKQMVTCILKCDESEIMVGTRTGIFRYSFRIDENDSELVEHESILNGKRITSMSIDLNNTIWVGTGNSGLFGIYPSGKTIHSTHSVFDKDSLSSNAVMSLFVDKTNVLWIGLADSGVCMTDGDFKRFHSISYYSVEDKPVIIRNVHSILESKDGHIWAGTYNGGVARFSRQNESLLNHEDTSWVTNESSVVVSILEDQEENIWIFHFNGTIIKCLVKDNSCETLKADSHITSAVLEKDMIHMSTLSNGILSFSIMENLFKRSFDFKNLRVSDNLTYFFLIRLKLGAFLAGTEEAGVFPILPTDCQESSLESLRIALSNYPHNAFAISAMEDDQDTIWIGTYNNGLLRVGKDLSITRISQFDGIHYNIKGILSNKKSDSVWLSTNVGLFKMNIKNHNIKQYDHSDGLINNEFNDRACCVCKDGTMYFGGINGITYFRPEEIKDNPYIPNIVITDFEIFNESVIPTENNPFLKKNISYAEEINLTHRESVFSFRFAALSFNNPQKNQYAYKMEGFDKEWTYCGNRRRVTYTNLDPGQYVFRVKGSNNDGIWNEEGTSIRINISPPYWKTWWFKSLGALALMAATGLTYKSRLEKIEKERKDQEEFSRKLIESQELERKRIASELHDTIAHDVLIAKNKALMALKHKDNRGKMEEALNEISSLASTTMSDVRNISYNLHPHQLERLGFTKTLKSIISEVSKSTDIKFRYEIADVDNLLTKENEINLFRVIQESVSNVIKHSGADSATLIVGRHQAHIFIQLADNGRGFSAKAVTTQDAAHGMGIPGIVERIKYMKGEYKIDSAPGKGATLLFKIPLNIL